MQWFHIYVLANETKNSDFTDTTTKKHRMVYFHYIPLNFMDCIRQVFNRVRVGGNSRKLGQK